jgi:hypothetical protein
LDLKLSINAVASSIEVLFLRTVITTVGLNESGASGSRQMLKARCNLLKLFEWSRFFGFTSITHGLAPPFPSARKSFVNRSDV